MLACLPDALTCQSTSTLGPQLSPLQAVALYMRSVCKRLHQRCQADDSRNLRLTPLSPPRDQGFLNSFYPYFAACPMFEPYATVGTHLAGPGSGLGVEDPKRGSAEDSNSAVLLERRGCRRLPTRYNGDWPLLFLDGSLQVLHVCRCDMWDFDPFECLISEEAVARALRPVDGRVRIQGLPLRR